MKLLNSIGPNPRIVRMFLFQKGVEIPYQEVDILGAENRKPEYVAKNPSGQLPMLELDNGECLAEVVAICEYIDEKFPGNSLLGDTPEEKAKARMWARRIDLNIVQPITLGFRYAEGADFFSGKEPIFKEASAPMKELAQIKLEWLNGVLGDSGFICGDKVTLADIMLFCFLEFAVEVGQTINPNLEKVHGLLERLRALPSAEQSA